MTKKQKNMFNSRKEMSRHSQLSYRPRDRERQRYSWKRRGEVRGYSNGSRYWSCNRKVTGFFSPVAASCSSTISIMTPGTLPAHGWQKPQLQCPQGLKGFVIMHSICQRTAVSNHKADTLMLLAELWARPASLVTNHAQHSTNEFIEKSFIIKCQRRT